MIRAIVFLLLLAPALAAEEATPNTQEPNAHEIIRRSVARDVFSSEQARNYTYMQDVEEKSLDSDGEVKNTKTETSEILMLYGEPYERLIKRDGNPLPPDEARKQEEKLNKVIERRKNETDKQRTKRLEEAEETRQKSRKFVRSIPDAFNFRLTGEETVAGREAWIVEGEPNPAFRPYDTETKRLTKFRGKIWVSKSDYEWIKVEAETIDNITFGGVLAKLNKGAVMEFEQTRVNEEVWLPSRVHVKFDAKLALVKSLRRSIDITFSDYKKFQSDSRILSTSPEPLQ